VFVNGVKVLLGSDYTETTQNSITFATGLTAGDEVELIAQQAFAVDELRADLADPAKGAELVAYGRRVPASAANTVSGWIDAQSVSLWEFADAVVDKPNPDNPSTWDWHPALFAALDYAAPRRMHVSIPVGTYHVTQTVYIPNRVWLVGNGLGVRIVARSDFVGSAVVEVGRPEDDLATGAGLRWVTVTCSDLEGVIGIRTTKMQELSGLDHVVVGAYRERGFEAISPAENFTLNQLFCFASSLATQAIGLYLETVPWADIRRVTVDAIDGSNQTTAGVRLNNSRASLACIHVEHHHRAILFDNMSEGVVAVVDGHDLPVLVEISESAGPNIAIRNAKRSPSRPVESVPVILRISGDTDINNNISEYVRGLTFFSPGAQSFTIRGTNPAIVTQLVRAASGQTAAVAEWQGSGGARLLRLNAAGGLQFGPSSDVTLSRTEAGVLKSTGTILWRNTQTVASSDVITLPTGNIIKVSGNNNISQITAMPNGLEVTLIFTGTLTVIDGSALRLAGNFNATPNSVLKLVSDGAAFYEVSRSSN
jgi:hypothetical protein